MQEEIKLLSIIKQKGSPLHKSKDALCLYYRQETDQRGINRALLCLFWVQGPAEETVIRRAGYVPGGGGGGGGEPDPVGAVTQRSHCP